MKKIKKTPERKKNLKTFLTKVFVNNIELKIASVVVAVIFWLLIGYFFTV